MKNVVGIDVAKAELVIYANGTYYTIGNTEKSLEAWYKKHKNILEEVDLYAYEPTGGYEKVVARWLTQRGLPGYRAHANHVRAYAKSQGYLAKTDRIDAKIIAQYCANKEIALTRLLPEDEALVALLNRRDTYVELLKQEKNRLEALEDKVTIKDIKAHIRYLEGRLARIMDALKTHVATDNEQSGMVKLITSIPGVGFITAVSILAYLPEISEMDEKSLGALVGLAPMANQSGKRDKKRRIYGGRSTIRRVLYMAALTATRYNIEIKAFYTRLKSKGKAYKVAITAAMRKLLTMIRSVCIRCSAWVTDKSAIDYGRLSTSPQASSSVINCAN